MADAKLASPVLPWANMKRQLEELTLQRVYQPWQRILDRQPVQVQRVLYDNGITAEYTGKDTLVDLYDEVGTETITGNTFSHILADDALLYYPEHLRTEDKRHDLIRIFDTLYSRAKNMRSWSSLNPETQERLLALPHVVVKKPPVPRPGTEKHWRRYNPRTRVPKGPPETMRQLEASLKLQYTDEMVQILWPHRHELPEVK